jgi:hypothetical protein
LDKLDVQLRRGSKNINDIRLARTEKSTLAEHSINLGHCIQLHNTSILAKKLRYMDHIIIREAKEIELHPNNINRENGFSLSRS